MPLDTKTADLMLTDFGAWENTLDDVQRQNLESTFRFEPDRVAAQKRFAAVANVAAHTGRDVEEVSNRFEDYYMHAFARDEERGLGLAGGVKDVNEFYGLLTKRANDNLIKAETLKSASSAAFDSALRGGSSVADFAAWQVENEHLPEAFGNAYKVWQKTRADVENELGPDGRAAAARAFRAMRSITGASQESDAWINEAKQDLINLRVRSPKAYKLALAAVQLMAADSGKVEKGVGQGMAENAGRVISDIGASFMFARPIVEMSEDASQALVKAGITNAENPERLAAQIRARREVEDDIRDMSRGVIDPVKTEREGWTGWAESAAYMGASSLPYMVSVMVPGGTSAAAGSFTSDSYDEFRSNGWEGPSAAAGAIVSGVFQAAVEKASEFITKIPGVAAVFNKFGVKPGSSWATQFLIRSGVRSGVEVGEEVIQEATTPFIQELTNAIMPSIPDTPEGKHLSDVMGRFFEADNFAPLLLSVLPLGLVGAAMSTSQDMDLMEDAKLFFGDDAAAQIMAETDPAKRDAMIRDKFKALPAGEFIKRARQGMESAMDRMKARFQDQESIKALQDTSSPEYTVNVTRSPQGWQVRTGDGSVIDVDSAEAARRIAVDLRQVGSQQEADALVNVIDDYYAAGRQAETVLTGETVKAGRGGVFGVRRDAEGNVIAIRAFDSKALETIRQEAEVAGIKTGTADIFAHVNGSNDVFPMRVADGAKEVARRLSLYKSQEEGQPQVITFLHENIESKLMLGLADGVWTENDIRTAFRALAPAFENVAKPELKAGQKMDDVMESKLSEFNWQENVRKLARGEGDSTMLRETFSEMYVRDRFALDRMGRATGMRPGSISRAIEAAVMGAKTQAEASAFKRILAMFRAFSAYLKGVFGTVKAIVKARDEGKIGEEWDTFVNKVSGIDEVKQMEGEAVKEAQEILDAGNMAFSTSRALPADSSNVTVMPDGAQLVGPTTFSITAYHGTPHKVNKFRMANIGTGEGAQAYGWGLYFAQSSEVAGQYQKTLSLGSIRYDGQPYDNSNPRHVAASMVATDGPSKALERALALLDVDGSGPRGRLLRAVIKAIRDNNIANREQTNTGNLYTVELLPDEDEFLDWDKPLSEQSEKVQRAIRDYLPSSTSALKGRADLGEFEGQRIYTWISNSGDVAERSKALLKAGIPGIRYLDGNSRSDGTGTSNYVIFDENLVKIIEENGQKAEGQTFSVSPIRNLNELSDQVERQFKENPAGALEVKSKVIRQFAKLRDKWSTERWTPKGDKIRPISEKRTAKSLDREQAYRKRARQRELIDEGMMQLTPETLMAWSEGVGTLEDHPFVKHMLNNHGRLMSESTAERMGKLKTDGKGNAGDYDDAGWIPPNWYNGGPSFKTVVVTFKDGGKTVFDIGKIPADIQKQIDSGDAAAAIKTTRLPSTGGIMPNEMAQAMYDDGLLKTGALAPDLWAELDSIVKSHRSTKEGYAKAEKAVRDVEKKALEQATKEAQQWRDEADKMQSEDWSPRESLVRDLITLEAIVAMFPQEIRGKIGGFVRLARKASESARLKVLQKQLERGQVLLEKHLREQYNTAILDLLDKAAPVGKPGEVKKSKFIVTVQDELDSISELVGMDNDDVAEMIAKTEAAIIAADSADAAEAYLTELNLLDLFGGILDIKNTSSQELEAAHSYLDSLMKQGREARKMLDEARRERVKEMVADAKRDAFKGQTGPETTQAAKNKAAKNSGKAMLKKFFNELSGYDGVLRDAFGPKSKTATMFSDRFTLNHNAFEDVQNERRKRFRDFARELYRTKLGAVINQKLIGLERIENNSRVTYLKNREVETHKFTEEQAARIVADPKSFGFTEKDATAISEEIQAIKNARGRRKVFTYEQVKNEGERVEIPLSQMDALYLSMALRQPGILEQQQRYGYDQETVDQLESFLTDDSKLWRQWMQGEYDAEYQRANEVYMRMFNARMPMIMFYAPLLKNHQGQQAILDPLNTGISSNSANPGSIKSRKARTSSLRIESALSVFWSHFNQMEYWIANAEYLRDVQSVMLNPEVREAVVSAHGEDGMATISAWVQLQMSRGVGKAALASAGNKMFRNVKSAISMKALALSYTTTLKTLPSVFYSLGEIHLSKWPAALVSGMKHWDRLWKTNIIQRRLDIGGMPELRDLGSSALPMSWVNQGIRYGSFPTMYADGVFTTYSAAMAYGTSFDDAKKQGASDEVAHKYAEERTALIVSKTAQPETWSQKSLFENDVSGAGALMFQFISDPRQKAALTGQALNQWRKGTATTEEAMRKFLAYWIIPGVMFQLANAIGRSLFKGDDDEWEVVDFATAALVGQLQGFVLLGSAAEMIFSAAIAAVAEKITGEEVKRKPFWNSPKNPLDQAAQELIKSVEKITKEEGEEGMGKAWEIVKSAGMLLAPMTPAGAIPSTAERVMKDTTNLFYDDK